MSQEVVIAKGMRLLMPNGPVLVVGIERYGIRVKTAVGDEEEVRWDQLEARAPAEQASKECISLLSPGGAASP